MVAERINLASVEAELDVLDEQEKRVAGAVVVSIGFTNAAVKDLAPREHEELAAYLFALLAREPVKTSPAYAGHRLVLGSLAHELRGFAAAAGQPVGLEADLRAATTQSEERRIRARLADQRAALSRYVDDAITAHSIEVGRHDDFIPDEPPDQVEEEPIDQPLQPPQSTEIDDVRAYL